MLTITDATKAAFMDGGSKKTLTITFYDAIEKSDGTKENYVITNDRIVSGSLSVKQSIQSGNKLDFIGCISSTASFKMARSRYVLKDKKVQIKVKAEGSDEEIILFTGKVDKVDRDSNYALTQKVDCYDVMNELLDEKDVTEWYDGLTFPISLKNFRNSLFSHLDIGQVEVDLPRDTLIIQKTLDTSNKEDDDDTVRQTQITAASVIEAICQINAVFGQITNDGKMNYIKLETESEPYEYTNSLIKKVKNEDIKLKQITGVVLYDGSSEEYSDTGEALAYYPEDKTKVEGDDAVPYEIKDNFILYAMNQADSRAIAKDIYEVISKVSFVPFEMTAFGMPWIQCGDRIKYTTIGAGTLYPDTDLYPDGELYPDGYETVNTIVMTRKLTGTGLLIDDLAADGEDVDSSITTINEIITAERFYRKIGDEKLYSEIEQTKDEIRMAIYDEDNGVKSQITQQANKIEAVIERQEFDYSAITTRLFMTEQAIELHAKEINFESETLKAVSSKMMEFETQVIDFNAKLVKFNDTTVKIVDLATAGSTTINGANITTGTINCSRIGLGEISIDGTTYGVDWGVRTRENYSFYGNIGGQNVYFLKAYMPTNVEEKTLKYLAYNDSGEIEEKETKLTLPSEYRVGYVIAGDDKPSEELGFKPVFMGTPIRTPELLLIGTSLKQS